MSFFKAGYYSDYILSAPKIIYLTQGAGTIIFEDKSEIELNRECLYSIGAGRISLNVKEDLQIILCRITEEPVGLFKEGFVGFRELLDKPGFQSGCIELNMMFRHFFSGICLYLDNEMADKSLFCAKITELLQIIDHSQDRRSSTRFFAPLFNQSSAFKMFVYSNLGLQSTVAELAKLANLSPRALNSRFRRYLGVSPKKFMKHEQAKVLKKELLDNSMPLKTIACEHGISVQYLNYLCKKEFDKTPAQMRAKKESFKQKRGVISENHK